MTVRRASGGRFRAAAGAVGSGRASPRRFVVSSLEEDEFLNGDPARGSESRAPGEQLREELGSGERLTATLPTMAALRSKCDDVMVMVVTAAVMGAVRLVLLVVMHTMALLAVIWGCNGVGMYFLLRAKQQRAQHISVA